MNVVNFGSLNLDHVYAVDHFCRAGETIHTAGYTQNAGGKGLNQSIAVARSGQTLCHAGMLGAGGNRWRSCWRAAASICGILAAPRPRRVTPSSRSSPTDRTASSSTAAPTRPSRRRTSTPCSRTLPPAITC